MRLTKKTCRPTPRECDPKQCPHGDWDYRTCHARSSKRACSGSPPDKTSRASANTCARSCSPPGIDYKLRHAPSGRHSRLHLDQEAQVCDMELAALRGCNLTGRAVHGAIPNISRGKQLRSDGRKHLTGRVVPGAIPNISRGKQLPSDGRKHRTGRTVHGALPNSSLGKQLPSDGRKRSNHSHFTTRTSLRPPAADAWPVSLGQPPSPSGAGAGWATGFSWPAAVALS